MLKIDVREIENEQQKLLIFLKTKIQGLIIVEDRTFIIDKEKTKVSSRDVKQYVKKFLYHEGFSKDYRVTEEHEVIRIVKRKQISSREKKKGTPPSPYDTLPYYFPQHP